MYKPRGSVPNWTLFRLAPVAFVLVSAFASAQQQPNCVPNTANYPCVYVANGGGSTVSVIDATTNKVIGPVSVGKLPHGLAITPDNAFVYVAVRSGSTVAVIDTATGVQSATVTGLTGTSPTQIAITPDGKFAYVVEVGGDFPVIDRIDTATNTVVDSVAGIILVSASFPSAIVIAPSGTLAYVAVPCAQYQCGLCRRSRHNYNSTCGYVFHSNSRFHRSRFDRNYS